MSSREALLQRLQWRTPLYSTRLPFVMCWSQKAGCTAVLKWFLHHAGLLDEAQEYGGGEPGRVAVLHRYENEVFKQAPGYLTGLADRLLDGHPVYCFLRCPYERAFSSYLHLHNPLDALYPGRDTPTIRLRRQILVSLYGPQAQLEYPVSFADYLDWLEQQDMSTLDPHHQAQYNPLYELVPVHFRRLEHQLAVVSALEEEFGLASTKGMEGALFESGHHTPKQSLSIEASLAFLERGLPLNRTEHFAVPRVTRDTLAGTRFAAQIESLYPLDVELYAAAS